MKAAVITSAILILCLILLRRFCKGRISSLVQYALWLVVAIRLIIPGIAVIFPNILPKSNLSVMNAVQEVEERVQDVFPVYFDLSFSEPALPMVTGASDGPTAVFIAGKVGGGFWDSIFWNGGRGPWCLGMLVVGIWMIAVNVRFSKRLRSNRKDIGIKQKNLSVYTVKDLDSPCLYGMPGRQCIYLPEDVAGETVKDLADQYASEEAVSKNITNNISLHHILIHEYCHYKHKDVFWAMLRCMLVTVYWFHPLVWAAAILSKRDCELACDEAAIRMLGEDERVSYGKTLLELITRKAKASDIACMATTMTASGKSVKERILRIAGNPKRVRVLLAVVVFMIAALSVFTFTQANNAPNDADLLSVDNGCFYIEFPETLRGKIRVTEENDTDILIHDRESGRLVGGFYRIKMMDAYNLIESETIYPIGNYGGNPYLYHENQDNGVPGTDSNSDMLYIEPRDSETIPESSREEPLPAPEEISEVSGLEGPIPAPEEVDAELINLPYTEGQSLDLEDEDDISYLPVEEIIAEPISETDSVTIHNYEPNSTITETYQYDIGASEIYISDDGSAVVGMFCYIYRPASYTDAKEGDIVRLEEINQELITLAESGSVKVVLMSGAAMEQILEIMVEYRTPYVGAAFKTSQLVDSVPEAEGLRYQYMEMDTGQQPYGITVHCYMLTDNLADIDQDVCLLDAILLFASVENLDQVTIAIAPEQNEKSEVLPVQDAAFITYYRTNQEERFGELYPCSETKEDMIDLYQRVKDALEGK